MPEEVNRADNGHTRRAGLVGEHRKGDNLYANSVVALDAQKGTELWRFNTGGRIVAAPVTYEVSGRQFVAVAAGHDILAFALASFNAGQ
jgi:outer membrane protein assembly factor BamB